MQNIILNILLGVLSIITGVILIIYYQNLVKKNKDGGLSFNIQAGGIGAIMIGVYLILKGINVIN